MAFTWEPAPSNGGAEEKSGGGGVPPVPVGFGGEVDIVGMDDGEPVGSSVGSVGESVVVGFPVGALVG